MYYDEPGCPGCGVRDYGWELPDVRSTLFHGDCRCKANCVCTAEDRGEDLADGECVCEECGCECERSKIQIRINRVWDRECSYCGGVDWRPSWVVLKDGKTIATVPSESAAHAVVEAEWPTAEPDYDPAWESERWLRQAEGWGC